MRPAENIEKLVKNINIDTNAKIDEEILGEVVEAFEKSKNKKSASTQPNIWRIIMKSRIIKLAAAAVIIIAFMLITYLGNGTLDLTSTAFAQMTEAMKKMPWLHAVIEGTYSGKQDRLEGWISFESGIYASKRPSGEIQYHHRDILNKYDSKSKTITISFLPNDEFMEIGSVWGFWENMIKQFSEAEAEISQEKSRYEGKKTTVFKISSSPFGTPMEVKLTVDAEKNLPIFLNQKAFDANGNITIEGNSYFDYPENGPSDIYDLGVPRSAKVINNLPTEGVPQILEAYKSHRESAPSTYIAVVTNSIFDESVKTFLTYGASMIYRNDKIQRVDTYSLPQAEQKEWRQTWLKFKEEMGDSLESLLKWWTRNGLLSNVNLYDGKFQYEVNRENDTWIAQPKRYMPLGDLRADNDLADFGWGVHFLSSYTGSGPFTIVETEYSKKHNVVCVEITAQGRINKDTRQIVWALPPKRVRCYLNPERDYICQRFEQHELFEAPWQEDKTWLEHIEKNNIKKHRTDNRVREVVEFGQTESGQWYPKKIKSWNSTDTNNTEIRIKKIYLTTNSEFPDGIFDTENLPKAND